MREEREEEDGQEKDGVINSRKRIFLNSKIFLAIILILSVRFSVGIFKTYRPTIRSSL